jgi:hypothetical protein
MQNGWWFLDWYHDSALLANDEVTRVDRLISHSRRWISARKMLLSPYPTSHHCVHANGKKINH